VIELSIGNDGPAPRFRLVLMIVLTAVTILGAWELVVSVVSILSWGFGGRGVLPRWMDVLEWIGVGRLGAESLGAAYGAFRLWRAKSPGARFAACRLGVWLLIAVVVLRMIGDLAWQVVPMIFI
jgi:hypothetical protein